MAGGEGPVSRGGRRQLRTSAGPVHEPLWLMTRDAHIADNAPAVRHPTVRAVHPSVPPAPRPPQVRPRTPDSGSGSHTPATTPTSSATAAGAVGFVTSGRMQDPSRPEPPVSGGSSAQGCGFCAPAVLQLLRFLRSEGTRQGVNGDAILLYGCSCPPVVGRVGCSTRSSPSVFPLSTAGIPSLIQTGAGAS